MKVMLVGGGSGGHITPLLSIARSLKSKCDNIEIIAVCEKQSRFKHLLDNSEFIDVVTEVQAGKYRRYAGRSFFSKVIDIETIVLNIRDVFRVLRGYIQSKSLIKEQSPDVVFIKGGFVGVPVGLAAKKRKVPYVTHDSDSIPGLANRIIGRWAERNLTGMATELYSYPMRKAECVGVPIDEAFKPVSSKDRSSFRRLLQLPQSIRVITVIGGSLGGQGLNELFLRASSKLLQHDKRLHILHIAGDKHQQVVKKAYEKILTDDSISRVHVFGFVDNVVEIQGAANVVVTRAGATQLAELSTQGLPVVVVPALLAGDHQRKNADFFASKGAAVVLGSDEDSTVLLKRVIEVLDNKELSASLSVNIRSFSSTGSAEKIAGILLSFKTRQTSL